jgi:hypothetical protein
MDVNNKKDNSGDAMATLLVAGVGSAIWDGCFYTGMVVGGPIGAGIGWCIGAGLFAMGMGVAVSSDR